MRLDEELLALLTEIKSLAVRYAARMHRPLGVTGEIAEIEAAYRLNLTLADAREPYFDAFGVTEHGVERIQVKGRAVDAADRWRGRMPAIKCDGEFESVVLVILDKGTFEPLEMWRACRLDAKTRLEAPGSISRNLRNAMGLSQFRSIATCIWKNASIQTACDVVDEVRVSESTARVSTGKPRNPGLIGAEVRRLLSDPNLTYSEVTRSVRAKFSTAQTSVKSVASTARDLRKMGVDVPPRMRLQDHQIDADR